MKFTKRVYRHARSVLVGATLEAHQEWIRTNATVDKEAFYILCEKTKGVVNRGRREKGLWK